MSVVLERMAENLINKINYINISDDKHTLFEWTKFRTSQSYILDLNQIRKNEVENVYFHIEKSDMKIAYIRKDNLTYLISAQKILQYQILEAILDQINSKFHETFDLSVIMSYGAYSDTAFKHFKHIIENDILSDFHKHDLIRDLLIYCKTCKKSFHLFIKKNEIEDQKTFPVPIVYRHEGHATICFIDKNFVLRGVKEVRITG